MEHVDPEKVWIALVVLEYDDEGKNVSIYNNMYIIYLYHYKPGVIAVSALF